MPDGERATAYIRDRTKSCEDLRTNESALEMVKVEDDTSQFSGLNPHVHVWLLQGIIAYPPSGLSDLLSVCSYIPNDTFESPTVLAIRATFRRRPAPISAAAPTQDATVQASPVGEAVGRAPAACRRCRGRVARHVRCDGAIWIVAGRCQRAREEGPAHEYCSQGRHGTLGQRVGR